MARLKICRCGKLFEPKPWQVKHHKDKLCPDCAPKDPRATKEYRIARSARLRLAKNRCEKCGKRGAKKRALECHHADGNPHNHNVDNLRILCHDCHQEATGRIRSLHVPVRPPGSKVTPKRRHSKRSRLV